MRQLMIAVSLNLMLLLMCCCCGCMNERIQPPDEYTRTCNSDLDPGEILHQYDTKNYGCLLTCSILSPSSKKYSEFLNHYAVKTYYLSGRQCLNETYVCINGTCVINPLKVNPLAISLSPFPGNDINGQRVNPLPTSAHHGNVSVKFVEAFIKHDDNPFSKGDPYIKFFVNSRFIDRTATRSNTYSPKFNENFFVNSLAKMDVMKFEVWNDNSGNDDYIFSITSTCDEILSKRMNHKSLSHHSGLVNRVKLIITCAGFR